MRGGGYMKRLVPKIFKTLALLTISISCFKVSYYIWFIRYPNFFHGCILAWLANMAINFFLAFTFFMAGVATCSNAFENLDK